MKVRMKTRAAGPEGVLQPGQVVDLLPKMAQALVDGGYAEEVIPSDVERQGQEPDAGSQAEEPGREMETVEPPEQAEMPKKGRKRRSPAKSSGKSD